MNPRTPTPVLQDALQILAVDIESEDGVANAAIAEAAIRLGELRDLLRAALPHVEASAEAAHLLDGFRRRKHAIDDLVAALNDELR